MPKRFSPSETSSNDIGLGNSLSPFLGGVIPFWVGDMRKVRTGVLRGVLKETEAWTGLVVVAVAATPRMVGGGVMKPWAAPAMIPTDSTNLVSVSVKNLFSFSLLWTSSFRLKLLCRDQGVARSSCGLPTGFDRYPGVEYGEPCATFTNQNEVDKLAYTGSVTPRIIHSRTSTTIILTDL